jgi:hypothetical protein
MRRGGAYIRGELIRTTFVVVNIHGVVYIRGAAYVYLEVYGIRPKAKDVSAIDLMHNDVTRLDARE